MKRTEKGVGVGQIETSRHDPRPQEAINLALGAVCKPGDVVATESPTYSGILQSLAARGLQVLELPTHPTQGLDLDTLEAHLKSRKIACLIVTPNFSNPLGSRMSEGSKERLARLSAQHELPVIEDDIYGDLQHRDGRSSTLKSHDRKGWVLLCSSFSKTLAPGYRVGWIVPGPRFFDSIATPSVTQIAIADSLSTGAYDRWLRKLRIQLLNRIDWLGRAVLRNFPCGTRFSRPEGGFVLWVEMPYGGLLPTLSPRARTRGRDRTGSLVFEFRPLRELHSTERSQSHPLIAQCNASRISVSTDLQLICALFLKKWGQQRVSHFRSGDASNHENPLR